ncbi:hypothetical protein KSP39_PZI019197 [Platanthera zijinensis]|uniref:Enoyl reductase (ER) domain-containing protein n=1 Tax=Platanthera zijinensis TaxID=2320716 RepID=A0AAP0B1P7_9ASPA
MAGDKGLSLEGIKNETVDLVWCFGLVERFEGPSNCDFEVTDVAGVVIEVGSAVKNFKAGDKVISMLNFMKGGGLAEYAVASSSLTVHRPPDVSPAEGAGLPIAASTALQALKSAGAKFDGSGKPLNILITAASGGVGHYAVQLAKLANLYVTATCGARNVNMVKGLGADEVLDYTTSDGSILKSPTGKKYDAVIECTTGTEWSVLERNLSKNGKVVVVTLTPMTFLKYVVSKLRCAKKMAVPMALMPKEEDLRFLVGLVGEGKMRTVVDSRHLFSNSEDAWAKCMDGHATGKIIVEMFGGS